MFTILIIAVFFILTLVLGFIASITNAKKYTDYNYSHVVVAAIAIEFILTYYKVLN